MESRQLIIVGNQQIQIETSTIQKLQESHLGDFWLININTNYDTLFWFHDLKFDGINSIYELLGKSFIESQSFKHTITLNGAGRVITKNIKFSFFMENEEIAVVIDGILDVEEDEYPEESFKIHTMLRLV